MKNQLYLGCKRGAQAHVITHVSKLTLKMFIKKTCKTSFHELGVV